MRRVVDIAWAVAVTVALVAVAAGVAVLVYTVREIMWALS